MVMMSFRAFLAAEGIFNSIVRSRNGMNNAFINKCLKSAIDRDPVKSFERFLFHIMMTKRNPGLEKNIQDSFPAIRYT